MFFDWAFVILLLAFGIFYLIKSRKSKAKKCDKCH
jgi:hypothetical protein